MFYNQAYADLLNGENNYLGIGKPVKDFRADIWHIIHPLIAKVKDTGAPVELEDQLFILKRNALQEERFFSFCLSPIWVNEGIGGVMNMAIETTEKVLNTRRLHLEHARMEKFIHQVPAAVCILGGENLKFELVNPAYQKLFPGRELVGKNLLDALPEIKDSAIHHILLDVYRTGKTFEGKELLIPLSRNGGGPLENLYFNFIYQARYNPNLQIDGIEVFAFEVTDLVRSRKSAEQLSLKLEEQAKVFDITLTAIKDFVYTFDTEGRFTYSNKALLELLEIDLEEIKGKNFFDLPYPKDLAKALQSQIARVVESGRPIINETAYTNPSGKSGYYEYIFVPIFDQEGKVALVAGSTREISERKKHEQSIKFNNEELVHVNNELIRVNSDLDNFIYAASHDLKTPISNIEGLIIALTKHLSAESRENPFIIQLLQMINDSIERFNKTIQDLTEITKLERIKEDGEEFIHIESLVEDIKLDLSWIIQESRADIQVDLTEIEEFRFSSKNIRSIFYNLISNSLKYRSPDRNPNIKIGGKKDPDFQVITVQDNGLGMDLSQKDFVFGMFKRLHNHVEGSGIGLFIVKKIMDQAGGKIKVESKVGEGSTFTLYFKKA
jgi:PAS domain S-box-containing protein